jgi:hypothetical protein
MFITQTLLRGAKQVSVNTAKKWYPGHYIYGRHYDIENKAFTFALKALVNDNPGLFAGWHNLFYWSDLEDHDSPGVYDFSSIIEDLNYAHSLGLKMIVQIQDRNYQISNVYPDLPIPDLAIEPYISQCPVPRYLITDPVYNGGLYRNFRKHVMLKRWFPAVEARFSALITALGAAIDSHPALAALNLEETALGVDTDTWITVPEYTAADAIIALKSSFEAATLAFPTTIVCRWTNFIEQSTVAQREEYLAYQVETCNGAFGAPDTWRGYSNGDITTNAFGFGFARYKGRVPIVTSMQQQSFNYEADGYESLTTYERAEAVIDSAISNGATHISWFGVRDTWFDDSTYTILDVIDVLGTRGSPVYPGEPTYTFI